IKQKRGCAFQPDSIAAYFRLEWLPLTLITLSGLAYNVGLLAGPWFEGRLAQCLADILGGNETAAAMTALAAGYILVTLLVQAARFIKRFYVRRFANNINRRMKGVLYANPSARAAARWKSRGAGELMTKAISDVDDCAEGIRKFTTEVFDTAWRWRYIVMLFVFHDRHLGAAAMDLPAHLLYLRGEDEKAGANARARHTKSGGGAQRGDARPGEERRHLSHLLVVRTAQEARRRGGAGRL
ncbi:MAG: hypothetical protein ACLUI3_16565, partial [Christensenellales bacterium]